MSENDRGRDTESDKKIACDFPGCEADANLELRHKDPKTRLTRAHNFRCMKHVPKHGVNWQLIEGRML